MEFLIRLARVVVGLLWLATLVFTIIPSLFLWVIFGRNPLMDIAQWVAVVTFNKAILSPINSIIEPLGMPTITERLRNGYIFRLREMKMKSMN